MPQFFNLERSDGFKNDYLAKQSEARSEIDEVLRFLVDSGPTHNSLNSNKNTSTKRCRREIGSCWSRFAKYKKYGIKS